MITLNFINKVHTAFGELHYHKDNNPNRDDFLTSAVDVIAHCYDLEDAINAVSMVRFCIKKWYKSKRCLEEKRMYTIN